MIFQDPMTSLNPVLTIGFQISEALQLHMAMNAQQARDRTIELLSMVGIPQPDRAFDNYPHQFSGGMRQRAMIAMAISCMPQILIADEPTTALDVTIQAQIIDLVKRLRDEIGMAIIWITHDLGIIAGLAQRVIVMYAGFIVEHASVDDVYDNPRHPYTLSLLGALPRVDMSRSERLTSIPGLPPNLIGLPKGCPFAPRCHLSSKNAGRRIRRLTSIAPKHEIACWVDVQTGGPAMRSEMSDELLVHVENLKKHFPIRRGIIFQRQVGAVQAVDGRVVRHPPGRDDGTGGRIGLRQVHHGPDDADALSGRPPGASCSAARIFSGPKVVHLLAIRRKAQMIFQDPYASLNPRWTVNGIVGRAAAGAWIGTGPRSDRARSRAAQVRRAEPDVRQPLPARVFRRAAPAHRCGARTGL